MNEALTNTNLQTFHSERTVSAGDMVCYDIRDGKIVINNDQTLASLSVTEGVPTINKLAPSKYILPLHGAMAVRTLAKDVRVGDVILVQNNKRAYPRFVVAIDENTLVLKTAMAGGGLSERLVSVDELSGQSYHFILQNQGELKLPGAAHMYELETKGFGSNLTESFKKAIGQAEAADAEGQN